MNKKKSDSKIILYIFIGIIIYIILKSFETNLEYLNIGRINVDEKKGINIANKLNALDNGIPSIKLIISQSEIFDIMTRIEEPFPNANTLKKRIDKILKEKGKLSDLKNSNENEL